MSDHTIDFEPSVTTMRRLVADVRDDQLTGPTPCPDYTVGDLVDHIGGLTVAFTGAATKTPVPGSEQGGSGDASRLEPGWRERIDRDLVALAEAWTDPSAYAGETMAGPIPMDGASAAAVTLNEIVVHGWDLATATGQAYDPAPADVETCIAFAGSFEAPDGEPGDGPFGRPLDVPVDAPPLVRLLGLVGRRA